MNLFLLDVEIKCARGIYLWRNTSSDINKELYQTYQRGNPKRRINNIVSGTYFYHYVSTICLHKQLICIISTYHHKAKLFLYKLTRFYILLFGHLTVFDFLNSNEDGFNVTVRFNSTTKGSDRNHLNAMLRIPRSVNLVYFLLLLS